MDRTISWGVLATCAGLAACAGGTNDIVAAIDPTAGTLDSALPFGASNGLAQDMLSADSNGVADNLAKITFNANQTYTITLPGGAGPIMISGASIFNPAYENFDLGTTTTTYTVSVGGTDADADVHLGEDDLGRDLFILARIEEDVMAPSMDTLSFVVFGDETAPAALPTGDGVAYTGGFISEVFDAAGVSVTEYLGGTVITANFELGNVDILFSETSDGSGVAFQGTGIPLTGARYEGDITSTGGGTAYEGRIIGGFYGAGAEATAGSFNAVDLAGPGDGDDLVIIGGFTGFQ